MRELFHCFETIESYYQEEKQTKRSFRKVTKVKKVINLLGVSSLYTRRNQYEETIDKVKKYFSPDISDRKT